MKHYTVKEDLQARARAYELAKKAINADMSEKKLAKEIKNTCGNYSLKEYYMMVHEIMFNILEEEATE